MSERPAAHAHSPAQLIRLEAEWRQLQRAFAFHPRVEIIPLAGDPPGEYQVLYKLKTLAVDAAGQLAYVAAAPVHLWLPTHFPHEAPIVRPMAAMFHPNVSMEWIHLSPAWRPDGSLVEVIIGVAALLAFRTYDPGAVLNPAAMRWVYANAALLPTDEGDFSPDAGGEPLTRVARHGPAAIDEQRRKADALCDRLVSRDPPAEAELRQFAWGVQLALSLFDDPDVPEPLRAAAAEVEETVLSMQGPASVWSQVARQVATAEAVGAAVDRVTAAEAALAKALEEFDAFGSKWAGAAPAVDAELEGAVAGRTAEALTAARQSMVREGAAEGAAPAVDAAAGEAPAESPPTGELPSLAEIQPLALELRRVTREGEQAVAELRTRLAQLAPPPRTAGLLPGRMLTRRLRREAARAASAAEPARASGAVLASAEPVLDRARRESAAVDRLAAWADYAELVLRGDKLHRSLAGSEPARLHAFFAVGSSGPTSAATGPGATDAAAGASDLAGADSGPLEYERPLELAGRTVAVSNPRGASLRVIDADTEELIASGEGAVSVGARFAGAGAPPVTLRAGQRTEELRVQLEYVLTQTRDALARLIPDRSASPEPEADDWTDSWAGRLAAAMGDDSNRRDVVHRHRRSAARWKALLSELAAVGRFKQRLATYHLLMRLIDFVPRAQARADRAREILARTDSRLAEIASRSARDLETGQVLVPQHLAGEYADRLAERDRARHEIAWAAGARQSAAERARARLAKTKYVGSGDVPALRHFAALPDSLVELGPRVTDAAIEAQVARLEELLSTRLRPAAATDAPAAHSDRV